MDGLSLAVIAPDLRRAGGAERLALECVRRWQGRHRVTLYSRGFDEERLAHHGIGEGVARRRLSAQISPDLPPGLAARLIDAWAQPRAWSLELGEHDVYLAHQWPTLRLTRRPLVWYAHELHRFAHDLRREQPDQGVNHALAELLSNRPTLRPDRRHDLVSDLIEELNRGLSLDRVVANSRYTAATLAGALGRDDVDVVHPGVDREGFLEPEFEEPYFLSVGSLHSHKRQRLAIEAVSLVPGAQLVVVGRGPEGPTLERIAARLGVQDRVTIRSDVDDAELRDLYAGCRAVLFTPVREPFGMVALEALAAGKPLVAVDEGGFVECVDASCAVLVPPEPGALAEALRALLASPEDARRMGSAGRKLAEAFPWERTAGELEAILLETHAAYQAARAARPEARRTATLASERVPRIGVRLLTGFGDGRSEGAWRQAGPGTPMPRAGFYASHHESTLRRQLAEIASGGFDFVTLCLQLDDRSLCPRGAASLRHALALAPELGPAARFAVELVLASPLARTLARSLAWLEETLQGHEDALVLHEDRPLVLLQPGPVHAGAVPEPSSATRLGLRAAPVEGEAGPIRSLAARPGSDWGAALRALCEASPPCELVIVSSWNDPSDGTALEPSVRDGERRLAEARARLATLPGRAPR